MAELASDDPKPADSSEAEWPEAAAPWYGKGGNDAYMDMYTAGMNNYMVPFDSSGYGGGGGPDMWPGMVKVKMRHPPQMPQALEGSCTVMMRNLPNDYTQKMLMREIDEVGFRGSYDFFYLPIDIHTHVNKGYAFINFMSPADAMRFKGVFDGTAMQRFRSHKRVSVNPASVQGFDANHSFYASARCHNTGHTTTRPLFAREGFWNNDDKDDGKTDEDDGKDEGDAKERQATYAEVLSRQQGGKASSSGSNQNRKGNADRTNAEAGTGSGKAGKDEKDNSGLGVLLFCPYCGSALASDFLFCCKCGQNLSSARATFRDQDSASVE